MLSFKEEAVLAFIKAGSTAELAIDKAKELVERFCKEHGHDGQKPSEVFHTRNSDSSHTIPATPCQRCGAFAKE